MKLKTMASAKIKRRYISLEASKEDVEKAILDYIGILGWARASLVWVDVKNSEHGKRVLSVAREELMNVRAAFEASPAKIKVLRVSGTLKGLRIKG